LFAVSLAFGIRDYIYYLFARLQENPMFVFFTSCPASHDRQN